MNRDMKRTINQLTSGKVRCPVAFRSLECGYQGDANWCDRTLQRCAKLGNMKNFGGRDVRWWQRPAYWFNAAGTVLILGTVAARPVWPVAAALYTISSILLLPSCRSQAMIQASKLLVTLKKGFTK